MNEEHLLMAYGEELWCGDCAAVTIHVPVEDDLGCWCCATCDAATIGDRLPPMVSTAA